MKISTCLSDANKIYPQPIKTGLAVAMVATLIFAAIAALNMSYYPALLAGGIGGSTLLFSGVWAYVKLRIPSTPANWNQLLAQQAHRANLADQADIDERGVYGMPKIPLIGNYDQHYQTLFTPAQILWKLPSSQLHAFPAELRAAFAEDARQGNLEIYFNVVTDSGGMTSARNLVLHPLVMPDYNPANPNPDLLPSDVGRHLAGGFFANAEVNICDPVGISPYQGPNGIAFGGDAAQQHVHVHPAGEATAFSPNNCRFRLDNEHAYHSFYCGVKVRGRAYAFFTIITPQNEESPFQAALGRNLSDFARSDIPFRDKIEALIKAY